MVRTKPETEFAGAVLDWAARELAMTDAALGRALGVDEHSVRQWRHRRSAPPPALRARLQRLAQLQRCVDNAFRTREVGHWWLRHAIPALNGQTPMSRLEAGDVESVLRLLATHASGAFV